MSDTEADVDQWIRLLVEAAGSDTPSSSGLPSVWASTPAARRWPVAAAAATVALVGAAGAWWAFGADRDGGAPLAPADTTVTETTTPTPTPATAASVPSTTASETTTLPPPTTVPEPELTRPVLDLDGCVPTWARESSVGTLDRAYILLNNGTIAFQLFTTPSGSLVDQFAVVGRVFANQRFDGSSANADVNGLPARAGGFGEAGSVRERWGDLIWRLPDGSEAYLRTSTMTRDELLDLAASLQPRPADAVIPGFDVTRDSYVVLDENVTPFEVGPITSSACEFETGGWLRVSVLEGTSIGDAVYLTDRPFEEAMSTQQLDDGRIITVGGRPDVSPRSAEALATVRQADDDEWQRLLDANINDFEPFTPPPG
jgi:hypothetical protein